MQKSRNDYKKRLLAICLLDGRNWDKVNIISDYFSEFALIKYRVRIEISYLIFLSESIKVCRKISSKEKKFLNDIWIKFSANDALKVKKYEEKINHDVKSVEYFLQDKLSESTLIDLVAFLHFGLTSYDVNIPAYGLMLKDFKTEVMLAELKKILDKLKTLIKETKSMVMLARTHGQPALPTTMGKELAVYYKRISGEMKIINEIPIEGKLTGAVGNFNSLKYVLPKIDWISMSQKFIGSLGLASNIFTTQIMPYDSWLRLFDSVKRLNNILIGLSQDIWWYISFEYFLQKKKEKEVGSSTMSHKINPITFENAEGNLGFANAQLEFFVKKLSVSRLQRDLSDSTVKRDFGLVFGFCLLAYDSLLSGLSRISPNKQKMKSDLDGHWEIFSEGIQTYLRMKGFSDAFEKMKKETRGKVMNRESMRKLINNLPISDRDKKHLMISSLDSYLGLAEKLAESAIK